MPAQPSSLVLKAKGAYHFALAYLAAILYRFPSRRIPVIAVTGTKGKSSTLEFLNAIFEEAGYTTALLSTIREKVGSRTAPNRRRMSMPGRFFLQSFLSRSLDAGCNVAFLEMTSEGARQFRHRFIHLDALIFINLSPEHIESHGSYQAYSDAKFELGLQLQRSLKRPRYMVANADDAQSGRYLSLHVEHVLPFSLSQVQPWHTSEHGGSFEFEGVEVRVQFPGEFSLQNALAAATLARAMGVEVRAIARGIESLTVIPGRAEEITEGQLFPVIVDYAHTPESLRAIYSAYPSRRKICVLGSTGGGRDVWKRPVMGEVADQECDHIILTNEDPYDEDPRSIVEGLARGIKKHTPEIIMDRRAAIEKALTIARASDVVIITGKGTDPTIQGPRGTSIPWSDAEVTREEIRKVLALSHASTASPSRLLDTDSPLLESAKALLGSEVHIVIDRPKGSQHPTENYAYALNAGYIDMVRSPEGEALEAYYLGEAMTQTVSGIALALVKHLTDGGMRLIVVPFDARDLSNEDIEKAIAPQEQWFKHEIIRKS